MKKYITLYTLATLGVFSVSYATNLVPDTNYDFESYTIGDPLTAADDPFSAINAPLTGLTVVAGNGGQVAETNAFGSGSNGRVDMDLSAAQASGTLSFDYTMSNISGSALHSRFVVEGTGGLEIIRFDLNDNLSFDYLVGNGSGGNNTIVVNDVFTEGVFASFSFSIDTATDTWGFNVAGQSASGLAFRNDRTVDDITSVGLIISAPNDVGQIDNIQFASIPEPGVYAFTGGLLALGVVIVRRRIY